MSYIVGHPIKHLADFYGRREEVARLFEIVGGRQAQSVSVLGLRRVGKTSFLKHIAHPEVMAKFLPNADDYRFIYLDMSSCKSPSDFYHRLLQRLKMSEGNADIGAIRQSLLGSKTTLFDVESYLSQFPSQCFILLLDEFDHLRSETFTDNFLTELRALASGLEYELACVTASYWDMFTLGTHLGLPPTSPFYNIFYPTPIYLSALDEASALSLIIGSESEDESNFTMTEAGEVLALSGTLPFFIQATAAKWLRYKLAGNVLIPDGGRRQLADNLAPYFDQWWHTFSSDERTMLLAVARGETSVDMSFPLPRLKAIERQLFHYGLIAKQKVGNGIEINGRIFKTWLRKYAHMETAVPNTPQAHSGAELARIRHALVNAFDLDELRTLCFDLGMDFESLPGHSKPAKARELVNYWRNRHDLTRLTEAIRTERGNII